MLRISYIFLLLCKQISVIEEAHLEREIRLLGFVFLDNEHICYSEIPWLFTNVTVQSTVNNHGCL